MTRWMLGALALLVATFSMSPAIAADSDENLLFPELISVDGNSTPVHPAIGEGKWTLVMLWATTCHICETDKPLFSDFYDKHKEIGDIDVFGISIEGHDKLPAVQKYLAKRNVSFPNSVGEFLTIGSSMINIAEESLRGTPTYLLFDPEGEIKGVHAGHLAPDKVEVFISSNG